MYPLDSFRMEKSMAPQKPIQQMFKVDRPMYRQVRMLAAYRSGTGKAASGQDIYVEAVAQYLSRNSDEVEAAEKELVEH